MKKVERALMLDEDAAALLIQLAGGPRKQGEYLSRLIRAQAQPGALYQELSRLEAELARLRDQVRRQLGEES
jgi:hypothetical protein